jgi:hypothetical protein
MCSTLQAHSVWSGRRLVCGEGACSQPQICWQEFLKQLT